MSEMQKSKPELLGYLDALCTQFGITNGYSYAIAREDSLTANKIQITLFTEQLERAAIRMDMSIDLQYNDYSEQLKRIEYYIRHFNHIA